MSRTNSGVLRSAVGAAALALLVALSLSGPAAAGPFEDGLAAYATGDYATAVSLWSPLAEQGFADAQYSLGVMYDLGQGVPQDHAEAVRWYRMSAEQGAVDSQFNLGVSYYIGEGVPQDYAEAARWYRMAAEQGNDGAQYNLGVMHNNGEGVPQDYAEATFWLGLAATQGHAAAQTLLASLSGEDNSPPASSRLVTNELEEGVAAYFREDFRTAFRLLQPLAENGQVVAQRNVGLMYDLGNGMPIDDAQAIHWYRLAAAQEDGEAQYLLGTMFDYGEGTPEDNEEAIHWYRLAAEQEVFNTKNIVASYDKFRVDATVLEYSTASSGIDSIDSAWLEDILLSNPSVTTIQLTSSGGSIEEAYDMAEVILDFELDTHVVGKCNSACVLLFLAGETRTVQRGSEVGFHQSKWAAEDMRRYYDLVKEDRGYRDEFEFAAQSYLDAGKDTLENLRYMLERGIDPIFATQTLQVDPDDIWHPRRSELLEAGVITQ